MSIKEPQRPDPARVEWTASGRRSLTTLIDYLETLDRPESCSLKSDIDAAIEKLRPFPLRCPIVCHRNGNDIRKLVVKKRFLVYYVYFASRKSAGEGRLSIRAVVHAARRSPLLGVREQRDFEYESSPGLSSRVMDADHVGAWVTQG